KSIIAINLFSIFIFVLTLKLISYLVKMFNQDPKINASIILLIAFSPSNLIYNSLVMSESTQLFTLVFYTTTLIMFLRYTNFISLMLLIASQWLVTIAHTGFGLFILLNSLTVSIFI